MPLALPRKTIELFSRAVSPEAQKKMILEKLGDLSEVQVMFNMVLVVPYIEPEKSDGGIFLPQERVAESIWQGKSAVVVKMGPDAFVDDEHNKFNGQKVKVGDWCVFKIGDAWLVEIKKIPCRLVEDSNIKMVVTDPSIIF